jgi:hypothetical protein
MDLLTRAHIPGDTDIIIGSSGTNLTGVLKLPTINLTLMTNESSDTSFGFEVPDFGCVVERTGKKEITVIVLIKFYYLAFMTGKSC